MLSTFLIKTTNTWNKIQKIQLFFGLSENSVSIFYPKFSRVKRYSTEFLIMDIRYGEFDIAHNDKMPNNKKLWVTSRCPASRLCDSILGRDPPFRIYHPLRATDEDAGECAGVHRTDFGKSVADIFRKQIYCPRLDFGCTSCF